MYSLISVHYQAKKWMNWGMLALANRRLGSNSSQGSKSKLPCSHRARSLLDKNK
jgi:hypothetical protein